MKKLIYILLSWTFITGCNPKAKFPEDKATLIMDTIASDKVITVQKSTSEIVDVATNREKNLPIYGELNSENLAKYFPGVTDTIKDLRIVGSEKIDLKPGNEILVSMLHNTGTFDQMILCTFDKHLNLIDNFYIGKATGFDKTSHTIEYKTIDENSMKFNKVDWGYVNKGDESDIDTLNYESYIISIDGQGKIRRK